MIEQNRSNKTLLLQLFATLNLIVKLFYDLSVQDLPPLFEDSLPPMASLLHKYLIYDNQLLLTDDDDGAGPLELVKSGIFEVLELWVQKYEDAFGEHVGPFVGSSWNLLTTVGPETKKDILVSKALQFLTAVTSIAEHAQVFNNDSTMSQVVERVVLPNLTLRDSDMDLFEDEPIEFIRRDLEGSDSDTRRRAATDFLRQLMAKFQGMVSTVVLRYISHYLSDYSRHPSSQWKSKDTAVYLYSSIAAKGAITSSQGVTSVNDFANVIEFFQNNIAKDLVSDNGVQPILKVDAIKYLYIFRSQLTAAQWQDAFPLLVKHLGSPDYVVHTYAAIALERTMALTTNSRPTISTGNVKGLAPQVLQHLFSLIEENLAPAKLQENEFLMRCVMRVLIIIKEEVVPLVDEILRHLVKITQISSENPSNPRFCYYLFEAIGAFIRYTTVKWTNHFLTTLTEFRFAAPFQPDKLETGFYTSFAGVLQNDVQGEHNQPGVQ